MGKEQNAEYYDEAYSKATNYHLYYKQSRYYGLWMAMVEGFDKTRPILDVGCGTGQTANLFSDLGFNYHGLDFSTYAIEMAEELNIDATFYIADIFEVHYSSFKDCQVFLCEVLEHLDDDLGLLEKINKEMENPFVCLSVPTFNDPSHVRYFSTAEEVAERYGRYFADAEVVTHGKWFFLKGQMK